MEIIKFQVENLNKVAEIEEECFPQKSRFGKDYFLYLWQKFPEGFWVVKEGEEILGYGIAQKGKKVGVIYSIAVKPSFQRMGIGSQILERLIEVLKKEKVEKIILHVREKNFQAIAFYQKFGFKIKERVENYYSNGENAFLMELKLKGA